MIKRREFVVFSSAGTLFAEASEREIYGRDLGEAVRLAATVEERYGATPYAFRFETRLMSDPIDAGDGGTLRVEPSTVDRSATYYLRGSVERFGEVSARGRDDERVLLGNMRGNGWPLIVVMDARGGHRWRSTQPFLPDDMIVDGDGHVIATGRDPEYVEYRDRTLATWA